MCVVKQIHYQAYIICFSGNRTLTMRNAKLYSCNVICCLNLENQLAVCSLVDHTPL